jgi:hypothetical protein
MPETSRQREVEIDEVFAGTLPLIQMALVHYRLDDEERKALERDLRLWFGRLVARTANDRTPVSAFRSYLLVATCQFAHSYQTRRARTRSQDPRLAQVLARSPRAVAFELQKMLEPERSAEASSGRAVG